MLPVLPPAQRGALARLTAEARDPEGHLELLHAAGELAAGSGELERAVEIARRQLKACQGSGQRSAASFVLGRRLLGLGQLEGALGAFEVAISEQPRAEAKAVAMAMAGQVLGALGRVAEARLMFESAKSLAGPEEVQVFDALLAELDSGT